MADLGQFGNISNSCNIFLNLNSTVETDSYVNNLLIVNLFLCITSTCVSVINILVLTRPALRSTPINVYLIALETASLISAVHYIPFTVVAYAYPLTLLSMNFIYPAAYLNGVAISGIAFVVWMTFVIGTWRLVAIVWPLRAKILLTKRRAWYVTLFVAFATCVSMTLYLIFTIKVYHVSYTMCFKDLSVSLTLEFYYLDGTKITKTLLDNSLVIAFGFFIIPSFLSILVTIGLIWNISKIARTRQMLTQMESPENSNRTNIILTIMLFTFLVCNATPYLSTMYLWNSDTLPDPWDDIFENFLPCFFVNCFSFFGYYYMGTKFRETFWDIFKLRCSHFKTSSPEISQVTAITMNSS